MGVRKTQPLSPQVLVRSRCISDLFRDRDPPPPSPSNTLIGLFLGVVFVNFNGETSINFDFSHHTMFTICIVFTTITPDLRILSRRDPAPRLGSSWIRHWILIFLFIFITIITSKFLSYYQFCLFLFSAHLPLYLRHLIITSPSFPSSKR